MIVRCRDLGPGLQMQCVCDVGENIVVVNYMRHRTIVEVLRRRLRLPAISEEELADAARSLEIAMHFSQWDRDHEWRVCEWNDWDHYVAAYLLARA